MANVWFIEWDTEPVSLMEEIKISDVQATKNSTIPHEILPNSCENHQLLQDVNNFW